MTAFSKMLCIPACAALIVTIPPGALAAAHTPVATAIVIQDQAALRAAPRDSATKQATLWRGEMLEIRGERLDYLQVYDHKRERAGYLHKSLLYRTTLSEAPALQHIATFLRDTPGSETLGMAFIAAYLKAAPAATLQGADGAQALTLLGTLAESLARRASQANTLTTPANRGNGGNETQLAAHLDVAAGYGIQYQSYERDGRILLCYEGDAYRRVLAMNASPQQRAVAALGLTRPECSPANLMPLAYQQLTEWRADILDRLDETSAADLPGYLKNRLHLSRAEVWASLAYQRSRIQTTRESASSAQHAAQRALTELASINKADLTDDDQATYNDAAMRTNAIRWAALPATQVDSGLRLITAPGQPGETCISLLDGRTEKPLLTRCTYSLVWSQSQSRNREGTALAVAVQPLEAWRELWVFQKEKTGWVVKVLPPASREPNLGYAEFAGWPPGGGKILVARESRAEGKYQRNFELLQLDTLTIERQAGDPSLLGAFQRWQDPVWKSQTVSVR